jgi:hypothetical protein
MFPTIMYKDLDFIDTISMGLNSIDAELKRPDDIKNPFDFDKRWSTASRTSESTTNTKYLELVHYANQDHTMTNNRLV